jgi:hypothetical protein
VKADIRDSDALTAIRPSDIAAYLRAQGWAEHQQNPDARWAAFTLNDFEVALPLTTTLRDYALRIADAIKTLEIAENRDQLQIVADLSVASADIMRVRVPDSEAQDGTLPLDRAVSIIDNTYSLMLAAACAAIAPKLYYASRKPADATNYMRGVRMGQTERGSFVVTVLSRLPPVPPPDPIDEPGADDPFQRRVTVTLAEAMHAANVAAQHTVATGGFEVFEQLVNEGVSANLCDSLSRLALHDGQARNVDISLSWARARPIIAGLSSQFVVTPDFAPVFQEAAKFLKAKAPREEFEARGPVFRLVHDPPHAPDGDITVAAPVDGTKRNIWIGLTGADYQTAIQAHANREFISVVGLLVKEGRRYRLQNPRNVRIVNEDEEFAWLDQ